MNELRANDPHAHTRVTRAKYGPIFTREIPLLCTGYDEREAGLIKEAARSHLQDISGSSSNSIGLNISGPYELTIDADETNLSLTFANAKREEKKAVVPLAELKSFISGYRQKVSEFSKSNRPENELRQVLENARANTHHLAAALLLQKLDPQGISISQNFGEAIFKAVCFLWRAPDQKNPYPDALLTESRYKGIGR